jgi:PAS domain S-box-containing protein
MLGRTPEEMLGGHIWSLFPAAEEGPLDVASQRARREGQPVRVEHFSVPLDRHFEVRIYPAGDDLVALFRDTTQDKRAAGRLMELAVRMAEAERLAGFGVWRWDIASDTVLWSAELHHLTGVPVGQFGGTSRDFLALVRPDDRARVEADIGRAIARGEPFGFEAALVRPDGTELRLMSEGRALVGSDGKPNAIVGVSHDVTQRVRAEEALGVSEQRMRAVLDNSPSAIKVRDLEGRYVMANAEAGRLLDMPAEEMIGRTCAELFPEDVARQFAASDRIAAAEGRPVFYETVLVHDGEPRTYMTVTFPLPDQTGRAIEICTIATDVTEQREREVERRERAAWRERITAALDEGRMVVFAQPVVDAASGEVTSNELLIRMEDEDGTLIQPAAFLPAAERFGLIQDIDAWVVSQAIGMAAEQQVEVNLSAVTLTDPRARTEIEALLAAEPEAAANIVFEITETAASDHLDSAVAFADELTRLGCALALDDFGTGFGTFTYLRQLPVRYLKIDLSFVEGAVESMDDRRVVQSIIGIAQQFGLGTIAEGVEDQATYDLLRYMGADYVQGFHLGAPAPVG